MAELNFCSQCGAERVSGARFCVACGSPFSKAGENNKMLVVSFALVMVLSLVLLAVFKDFIPNGKDQQQHAHHPGDGHNHGSEGEDPRLTQLIANAENGNAAALMDLAEYLVSISGRNHAYLAQAAETLERLTASYPDHAYSLRLLGNIYYDIGQPEKSSANYKRYLDLHPDDPNVHIDYGAQLLALGKTDEAIAQFEHGIRLFPNFYNAYFNLYITYQKLEQTETAAFYKEEAERIQKEYGKLIAPVKNLSRLPEGAAVTSASGRFSSLEQFFRNHMIIGPKMTGFETDGPKATLLVRQFPMDIIPGNMRMTLDEKIKTRLAEAGDDALLEIKDVDSNKVMATYQSGE